MTPPKDAPVTEAGRRLLAFLPNEDAGWHGVLAAILAIEEEAATAARSDEIDVAVLRRAIDAATVMVSTGTVNNGGYEGLPLHAEYWLTADYVERIAAAYARLRSEQGERTPRVDSEIDAT
jgi:hypothetical protein